MTSGKFSKIYIQREPENCGIGKDDIKEVFYVVPKNGFTSKLFNPIFSEMGLSTLHMFIGLNKVST